MIESLRIEGYRGFEQFEMSGLGRINLLVGRNNAGKTSVLEAIRLLATASSAESEFAAVAWAMARRRDEVVAHHARLRFMFWQGSSVGVARAGGESDVIRIADQSTRMTLRIEEDGEGEPCLALSRNLSTSRNAALRLALQLVDQDALPQPPDVSLYEQEGWTIPPIIGPDLLDPKALVQLFGRIVLTAEEDRFIDALRLMDGRIRRLGATSGEFSQLLVKLDGFNERLPLGNLGGGVSRFAQLWLSFLLAGRGPLLIDEIDSGLHHSVMIEMWRQVRQLAVERNVQVFATTHSWDCVSALGMMSHADGVPSDEVTLHRIDPIKGNTVRYSADRILIAAENGIEVR